MKKNNKKNKNLTYPTENLRQWRKNFIFNKRKEQKEQKKSELEQERAEIFERKRNFASSKKAPVTLRTKSFYRFSKDFPSNVDNKGFRENGTVSQKRKKRTVICTAIVCVLVFCISFTLAKTGTELSMKTPESTTTEKEEQITASSFSAYHFSYEELYNADTEKMLSVLKETGCDTAVFEYKTEEGYVIFPSETVIGSSANKRLSSSVQTVKTLQENGIKIAAYISCFKDSVASSADLSYSVRQTNAEGGNWLDNSNCGWLNPYSSNTTDYLITLVSEAAETGFDYIFLDNICFSTDAGNAKAYYPNEASSNYDRNTVLKLFVNSCMRKAENCNIIVMCDISGYNTKVLSDGKYVGNMLSVGAKNLALDLRLSKQAKTVKIGDDEFSLVKELPYVFVLEAAEYAAQELINSENIPGEAYVVLENTASLSEQITAVKYAGFQKIIIW